MINALPYVLLVLVYILIDYQYKFLTPKGKKLSIFISGAIYIFFFGLRGFIGDDWTIYYYYFNAVNIEKVKNVILFKDLGFEPGFVLLMFFVKAVINDFHFFVLICASLNWLLLIKFLKKYTPENPIRSLVFFVCIGGFTMQTDLMRNSISILIFINIIHLIFERKAFIYFLGCITALMFHSSSVLFFPLYFFLHRKISRKAYAILLIIGNLIFLAQIHYIAPILQHVAPFLGGKFAVLVELYTNSKMAEVSYGITIGYLERLLTSILILIYYNKISEKEDSNTLFINSYILYFILFFFFSEIAVIGVRLGNLFIFSYWILWSRLLSVISKPNNKICFAVFVYLYCLLRIVGLTSHPIWQYDNVVWGTKSYEERYRIREQNKDK